MGRGKEMIDRLTNLIAIFQNPSLDFSKNRAEGDDILGDAYEYLMRHFATESGKSKGQFYTPAEVSRILAKVIGINSAKSQAQTIYEFWPEAKRATANNVLANVVPNNGANNSCASIMSATS